MIFSLTSIKLKMTVAPEAVIETGQDLLAEVLWAGFQLLPKKK